MADFSESDINAAKRRVQEMRNKAQRFTDDERPPSPPKVTQLNDQAKRDNFKEIIKEKSDEEKDSGENSFFVILALIMLLSKEGADNMLILALLYLLL